MALAVDIVIGDLRTGYTWKASNVAGNVVISFSSAAPTPTPVPSGTNFAVQVGGTVSSYILSFTGGTNTVDWGDGNISNSAAATIAHTYGSTGTNTVLIFGTCTKMTFPGNAFLKAIQSPMGGFPNLNSCASLALSCSGLTNFYTGMLDGLTNITSLASAFQASGVKNIPDNAFWFDTNVTTYLQIFSQATGLTNIGASAFRSGKVTTIQGGFYNIAALKRIPADLFYFTTNIATLGGASAGNGSFESTGITDIPATLFASNNTPTLVVQRMFAGTQSLTNIPAGLIDNHMNIQNAADLFRGDTNFLALPSTFAQGCSNLTSVANMFNGNIRMSGTAPSFWDTSLYPGIVGAGRTNCFKGCTNLSNYATIDVNFK